MHSRLDSRTQNMQADYPYESSYEAVQGFERTTLIAGDRDKIAHGNAERQLRIG